MVVVQANQDWDPNLIRAGCHTQSASRSGGNSLAAIKLAAAGIVEIVWTENKDNLQAKLSSGLSLYRPCTLLVEKRLVLGAWRPRKDFEVLVSEWCTAQHSTASIRGSKL